MKKILVPTDFSDCADNAVQTAMEIALKMKADLHFLHFTAIPIDWVNLVDNQEKMYPDVTRRIKGCQEKLNELVRTAEAKGIAASTYIGYNESYSNIIKYVNDHDIDLVVMGSHGASGMKEFFLGSNAQKVIRLCQKPVLVVKPISPQLNADQLVVVSDFLGELDENMDDLALVTFRQLLEMAGLLSLKVTLLYVNTPSHFLSSKAVRRRMETYYSVDPHLVSKTEIINAETLERGLSDYLEQAPATILAMMTHGYNGLARLINGSVVEEVANHLDAPLISIRLRK